jgi:hypothetical protein
VHFYVYFSIERERRKREGERGGEGGEREREAREKLIDNQMDDWRSVSTTPLVGDTRCVCGRRERKEGERGREEGERGRERRGIPFTTQYKQIYV